MANLPPFIVTATLDTASQARFDALRRAHFPPERLVVGAHVTLFHALPGDLDVVREVATEAAVGTLLSVQVTGVRFLGRGVAFSLQSAALSELRNRLRQRWVARLTAQDVAAWQPHITIQNKVAPAVARTLHATLAADFKPCDVTATGLAVWIYRNGPWQPAGRFAFNGSEPV